MIIWIEKTQQKKNFKTKHMSFCMVNIQWSLHYIALYDIKIKSI